VDCGSKVPDLFASKMNFASAFSQRAELVLFEGDCRDLLKTIPANSIQLIVTSPPYNLGKEYERRLDLDRYVNEQTEVIAECVRVMSPQGSLCWQVGNFVQRGEIIPLDSLLFPVFLKLGLKLRNRVVWHFEHGLHCSKRFSGRYETISWFTKSDDYAFALDPVRVPQKYPGKKHFKGPKVGQFSGNPLGKNPGDVWLIPNVKSNHVEKTEHPCQFPVELVERLVLSMTREGDWILDPFMGVGSSLIAAVRHGRRAIGAEFVTKYVDISKRRLLEERSGTLRTRPMNRPVYDPKAAGNSLTRNPWATSDSPLQPKLVEEPLEVYRNP
jgi:adenine-specific DNA-methyltransferase